MDWMCVGAHPDDIELMAPHAIWECRLHEARKRFVGVVVTRGSRMPRSLKMEGMSREQIAALRKKEQKAAARRGRYSALIMLDRESADLRSRRVLEIIEQLKVLFRLARPKYVITHQLMDTHTTHVGVALAVVEALCGLPISMRPRRLFGMEVWGGLDWLPERRRRVWLLNGAKQFHRRLLRVFDSQREVGKNYADAAVARARAHTTFLWADRADPAEEVILGLDMTPLIHGRQCTPQTFVRRLSAEFAHETLCRLERATRGYRGGKSRE